MQFTHYMRLGALAGMVVLSAGLTVRAQEKAAQDNAAQNPAMDAVKLNAGDQPGSDQIKERLSRDEYEAAWVRLFDGTTTFGWEARGKAGASGTNAGAVGAAGNAGVGNASGGWTIADQALQAKGSGAVFATKTEFADFELAGECQADEGGSATLNLRAPASGDITTANAAQIRFAAVARGTVKPDTYVIGTGKWKPFYITLDGGKMIHSPDAKGKKNEAGITPRRGVVALISTGTGTVKFRNLKLRARNFKSIFNGKDLTGWTPLEGHQSVFAVAPDGTLNIKNGNGEIQSAGQYGDFALSLDVYSNGDHLNSGVFFRELPGKFWAGYEDQIRNQWKGDDRTQPVDFGTGAIYNRQAARKVVSSDREWFTLTLFVSGNHIASYVDGYQVADFTDTRPAAPDNNARNGSRTLPGCIGLQGHDPTTNLFFRNIRIVEMPKASPTSASTTASAAK